MRKLVYGVGINDADYHVYGRVGENRVMCKFYAAWSGMLERCYSASYAIKYPSYFGCSVCNEWLTFSNFRTWMEKQDWQGMELDKDLRVADNKVYSPETCLFIAGNINKFLTDRLACRGDWPIGVSLRADNNKFQANCKNLFTGKKEHLGLFSCPAKAHQAWRKRKHELACQLADLQKDDRVAEALRTKYI